MSKITFEKAGTMLYPLPAVMVSCGESPGSQNIITIAWTGTVNSEPPMAYISVRKSRYSHEIISRTGEFVINLTTEELVYATDFCGVKSGREVDKFKEMKLTSIPATYLKCPMIKECPVNIECKVTSVIEFPSHDMFIADVVAVHAEDTLFNDKGKLELQKSGLLCYSHGGYFTMKNQALGRFGYSIMKPKTKKRLAKKGE